MKENILLICHCIIHAKEDDQSILEYYHNEIFMNYIFDCLLQSGFDICNVKLIQSAIKKIIKTLNSKLTVQLTTLLEIDNNH